MALLIIVFTELTKPLLLCLQKSKHLYGLWVEAYGLIRVGIPVRCSSNRFNVNESISG